jgi:hypothetical protein
MGKQQPAAKFKFCEKISMEVGEKAVSSSADLVAPALLGLIFKSSPNSMVS